MRKVNYKEKGITLVALVITIILLLILAGVTLTTALGQNGLFKSAKTSAKKYNLESEREALSISVTSYQIGKNLDEKNEEDKIGETLNKKNLQHTSDWHIVETNDTTYDEGWNYVEKGTEIEGYGQARNSWLINYETGEIIQLEEGNYKSWSAGDMLAVKDNLIINIDSSIIDKGTGQSKEDIEKQLGTGVELHNFSEEGTDESGLTSKSFNFDGVDDYITVEYDKEKQKKALAEQGFTFEFYGTWDGGTSYDNNHIKMEDHETSSRNDFKGIFCYWNGIEETQAWMRFGIWKRPESLGWNAGWNNVLSDFSANEQLGIWNIQYPLNIEKLKENTYITVSLDTSKSYKKEGNDSNEEYYKQTMYINGEKKCEGGFNKKQWDFFITDGCLGSLKYFCFGRSSMHGSGWWHYSRMNAYCLRLYSKGLTDEEVRANYDKATKYHALLDEK